MATITDIIDALTNAGVEITQTQVEETWPRYAPAPEEPDEDFVEPFSLLGPRPQHPPSI